MRDIVLLFVYMLYCYRGARRVLHLRGLTPTTSITSTQQPVPEVTAKLKKLQIIPIFPARHKLMDVTVTSLGLLPSSEEAEVFCVGGNLLNGNDSSFWTFVSTPRQKLCLTLLLVSAVLAEHLNAVSVLIFLGADWNAHVVVRGLTRVSVVSFALDVALHRKNHGLFMLF